VSAFSKVRQLKNNFSNIYYIHEIDNEMISIPKLT